MSVSIARYSSLYKVDLVRNKSNGFGIPENKILGLDYGVKELKGEYVWGVELIGSI